MSNELPFEYGQIMWFNGYFQEFQKLETLYKSDKLDNDGKETFFNQIQYVVSFYWRFIKRIYKENKGIRLKTPKEGLLRAQSDGLINDAPTWLEFFEDINICMSAHTQEESMQMRDKIIEYYHTKVYSTLDYIHSEHNREILRKYEEEAKYLQSLVLEYDSQKPSYNCEEIGISERSYNILLEYFRSKKEIKNVWLHGSRAHGNAIRSSDIDMIVDCDEVFIKQIQEEIDKLKIPYICDASCRYAEKNQRIFYKLIKPFITKKIYCAEDFNIHWDNKNLTNSIPAFDISKIVTATIENNETLCQIGPYWQDYYRNEFDFVYTRISEQIKTGNRERNFNNRFINLFDTTLKLICIYLSNNGFYPNNNREIVRYAYAAGILPDPDELIIAEDYLYKYKNSLIGLEELVDYCANKHFYIFDNISNYFKTLLEQNGKTTD